MKASLGLPAFRLGRKTETKPWVSRVWMGRRGMCREFINAARDWSQSPVTFYFVLSDGVYEVCEPIRSCKTERYFLLVESGEFRRIKSEELAECLSEC